MTPVFPAADGYDVDSLIIAGGWPSNLSELFVRAKGPARRSEDIVAVSDDYVAVIDGMSSPLRGAGRPASGREFARAIGTALTALPGDLDARECVDLLTAAVGRITAAHAGPAGAVAAIYSVRRHQVWRIGDVHVRVGRHAFPAQKGIDDALAAFRAAYNLALLAGGASVAEIIETDPGLRAAFPLLEVQPALANARSPLGYGVFDGTRVPSRFIEVFDVGESDEVVLASDGYLAPDRSLRKAEDHLRHALDTDPAALGALAAMAKPLLPGAWSADDRSYVRLTSYRPETDSDESSLP
ncbi:hypothetical protein LC082_00145 [Microbacterium esteraromaticum]|uniref:hypothetical protein n=1 Tax=Microbacterium esteraromaticum TaxID=57043 RepID=UPI001CD3A952|nr:hypothetical protein [Microbacterium esteraromaticum]MCA1305305.1 hypothetical protein [Microbacterium esteraromaticum]